jgi:hypothetical protein
MKINYSKEEILQNIIRAESERSYCLLKNFVDKNNLPQWSDFMRSIYYISSQDIDEVLQNEINKEKESLVGNLIIQNGIYFSFKAIHKEAEELFPDIVKMTYDLPISFYGPKISIGPYFVVPHQDRWHAATLQCEGNTVWSLKDEKHIFDHVEKFDINDSNVHRLIVEPGDFLYFSQKLFHQIEVDGPRASMLFNSNGIYDILG